MTILVACHTTPTTGPGGTHRTWLTLTQTPSASRRPGCSTSMSGPDDYQPGLFPASEVPS